MVTRRLLPLTILPLVAVPRAGGKATVVATPAPTRRHCGDPGGSFIACEALQDMLPLALGTRCPLCGGPHRGGNIR
jgi:hypothetical protein